MKYKHNYLRKFVFLLVTGCQQQSLPAQVDQVGTQAIASKGIFPAQVAGRFYSADPSSLRSSIRGYLEQARSTQRIQGDLLGIIVPHAGHPFSGPVASHAFALLEKRRPKRVVVLGPAHRRGFLMPAVLSEAKYQTPLGLIPIDVKGISKLVSTQTVVSDSEKFRGEHGLEVELPFLQVALKDFLLVPIMIAQLDLAQAQKFAKALVKVFPDRDTIYVASTDLSHDYQYEVANALDQYAVDLIDSLDTQRLVGAVRAFRLAGQNISVGADGRPKPLCAQLCGVSTVMTLMELAKLHHKTNVTLLDRRNSGDIVGDKSSRIVGYAALAVSYQPSKQTATQLDLDQPGLTRAEKTELLQIARKTITQYLSEGGKSDFEPTNKRLLKPGAAFVTLKNKGRLRGCIGYMEPVAPLWEMVRDRAIDAAVHDQRFAPVTLSELSDIVIEISVLTPRVDVTNPLSEIKIGTHGVWLQLGARRGVFLPQVPTEQGWTTVEEYLDNLCRKAHIYQVGCWKSRQARIQRFSAIVFHE